MWRLMMVAVLGLGVSGAAVAQTSLRDVRQIDDGLFAVGLADQVRKMCPSISARYFRAIGVLRELERQARALGYSEADVEAHLNSDAEKNRLRARAADYMKARGYGQDQAGYCALGQAEIARNSTIGVLLRAKN